MRVHDRHKLNRAAGERQQQGNQREKEKAEAEEKDKRTNKRDRRCLA